MSTTIRPVSGAAERLRETLARGGLAGARAVAERLGQQVTPRNMHSPVPVLPPTGDPLWARRQELELDLAAQMSFVEEELAPFLPEFSQAAQAAERHGFHYWNGLCQGADAELLYALLRRLRPARVLETGSGFSTMVSAQACARNAAEGHPAELTAVDPQPRTEIGEAIDGLSRIERRDVRELPFERFAELRADDVLFIDTSHVVKLGSEVNLLFLEVLPRLAPGVWVHVHDIFLPYEYPRQLLEGSGGFNEQYLLQALLTGSRDWEVRLAVHALWREQRERLTAVIPALAQSPDSPYPPSSFWLRRSD